MKLCKAILVLLIILVLAIPACDKSKPSAEGVAAHDKPYVASVLRDPFHTNTCRWAGKIADYNLVGYDTRQEAIDDGHRPCKVCRP